MRMYLLLVTLMVLGQSAVVSAETVYFDEFNDESVLADWTAATLWPLTTFDVSDGDLRVNPSEPDNAAVIGLFDLNLRDSSIRAQVRIEDGQGDEIASVFLRGNDSTGIAHGLQVAVDGGVFLNIAGEFERIGTDLRPVEHDVVLQLDVIGDAINAWAWKAGETMPSSPLYSRTSSALTEGIPGVSYGPSIIPPLGGSGTALFRYVHVADVSIPEPSTEIMLLIGMATLVQSRRRMRTTPRFKKTRSADAMNYQLENVWPKPSGTVREEVVNFWLAESALPNRPIAEERAHQLLVVTRNENGEVAGVSTAVPALIPQLGFECFYYRTFVGSAARTRGLRSTKLFWRILLESHRLLNERFLRGCDPGVPGLYAEIESPSMMRSRSDLVWRDEGMNAVYIGRTQDGRHIRVWYFDGARIP